MKTSKQWALEIANVGRPESVEALVNLIKADAIDHAIGLLTANADSRENGFDQVFNTMVALQKLGSPIEVAANKESENNEITALKRLCAEYRAEIERYRVG